MMGPGIQLRYFSSAEAEGGGYQGLPWWSMYVTVDIGEGSPIR